MRFLLLIAVLISMNGFAQCKDYIIGVNGDTLNCVDISGKKQGRWIVKVESLRGEPGYEEEGQFINGKKEGTWRRYTLSGDIAAIENYRWGNKDGKNIYFNNMGNPMREETWKAVNPDNPYDTVPVYDLIDPTRIIERVVVKLEGFSLKHGTFKSFDPFTGAITKTERYWLDKPANAAGNGPANNELVPLDVSSGKDTTGTKTVQKPQAVLDFEKKNSGKKKSIRVRDGRTGN